MRKGAARRRGLSAVDRARKAAGVAAAFEIKAAAAKVAPDPEGAVAQGLPASMPAELQQATDAMEVESLSRPASASRQPGAQATPASLPQGAGEGEEEGASPGGGEAVVLTAAAAGEAAPAQ